MTGVLQTVGFGYTSTGSFFSLFWILLDYMFVVISFIFYDIISDKLRTQPVSSSLLPPFLLAKKSLD